MGTYQKRDADMDRLLRAALQPPPREAAGACPDADVLAAFSEGGLTATEQSAIESHIAGCGRCQEALAILSHDLPEESLEVSPAPQESTWFTWVTRPRLRWLVPISAVATVAVVFFATRPLIAPEGSAPRTEITQLAEAPPPPPETPQPLKQKVDTLSSAAPVAGQTRDKKAAQSAAEMTAARVVSEEKAAPAEAPLAVAPRAANVATAADAAGREPATGKVPAAPVAGASAMRGMPPAPPIRKELLRMEPVAMVAAPPDGMVRWRFGPGGRIWRSTDAGSTWHGQPSGVSANLVGGSAPSATTCWAVGTGGVVLLTVDGQGWTLIPFPLRADLAGVQAADSSIATVTTRDGGRFETRDGGLTWSPKR